MLLLENFVVMNEKDRHEIRETVFHEVEIRCFLHNWKHHHRHNIYCDLLCTKNSFMYLHLSHSIFTKTYNTDTSSAPVVVTVHVIYNLISLIFAHIFLGTWRTEVNQLVSVPWPAITRASRIQIQIVKDRL